MELYSFINRSSFLRLVSASRRNAFHIVIFPASLNERLVSLMQRKSKDNRGKYFMLKHYSTYPDREKQRRTKQRRIARARTQVLPQLAIDGGMRGALNLREPVRPPLRQFSQQLFTPKRRGQLPEIEAAAAQCVGDHLRNGFRRNDNLD